MNPVFQRAITMTCSCVETERKAENRETHLEVKAVKEFGDEREGGEEDLQSVDVCSVGLTQLNGGLECKKIYIYIMYNKPLHSSFSFHYLKKKYI